MDTLLRSSNRKASPYLSIWILLLVLFHNSSLAICEEVKLTSEEQESLKSLDNELVYELIRVTKEIKILKEEYESLSALLKSDTSNDEMIDHSQSIEKWMNRFEKLTSNSKRLHAFFDLKKSKNDILKKYKTSIDELKKTQYDPKVNFDLPKEEFYNELLELQGVDNYSKYLEVNEYYQTVIKKIEQLKNPSLYYHHFLNKKFEEWTAKPFPVGDSESLVFQIIKEDKSASIFDPNCNLSIKMQYVPGDIEVWATGLYFEYNPSAVLPTPKLEKLKVDDKKSIQQSAKLYLKELGNEFLDELCGNSGFKVRIDRIPDFNKINTTKSAGAIEFSVEFDWSKFSSGGAPIIGKANKLLLYPVQEIDISESRINITYKSTTPIPIGPTPFAFWEFGGSIEPKTKTFCGNTSISTTVTPARETIGLFPELCTSPPFDIFTLTGEMRILDLYAISEFDGKLDFSKGIITGEYRKGGATKNSLMGDLVYQKGNFELRSEQLVMDGEMRLLNQRIAQIESVFDFKNKKADLYGKLGLKLFGSDFGSQLVGKINEGFKGFSFGTVHSVKVVNIPPYGDIDATITVLVDSTKEEPVTVIVDTFMPSLNFEFSLASLDECKLSLIEKKLRERAGNIYFVFLKTLADLDTNSRALAASLDEKFREEADKKFGVTWRTGNKDLDRIGEEFSDFREQSGKEFSNLREWGGKIHTAPLNVIKNIGDNDLSSGVGNTWNSIKNEGGKILGF